MKQLPTYNEQFNKITEAYIRGEIKPYRGSFCFCGTLAGHNEDWQNLNELNGYTGKEYYKMERPLLSILKKETIGGSTKGDNIYALGNDGEDRYKIKSHPNYENALFNGMVAALEVLKQIHIERGEVIDQSPAFTKRLTPSLNH